MRASLEPSYSFPVHPPKLVVLNGGNVNGRQQPSRGVLFFTLAFQCCRGGAGARAAGLGLDLERPNLLVGGAGAGAATLAQRKATQRKATQRKRREFCRENPKLGDKDGVVWLFPDGSVYCTVQRTAGLLWLRPLPHCLNPVPRKLVAMCVVVPTRATCDVRRAGARG